MKPHFCRKFFFFAISFCVVGDIMLSVGLMNVLRDETAVTGSTFVPSWLLHRKTGFLVRPASMALGLRASSLFETHPSPFLCATFASGCLRCSGIFDGSAPRDAAGSSAAGFVFDGEVLRTGWVSADSAIAGCGWGCFGRVSESVGGLGVRATEIRSVEKLPQSTGRPGLTW